MTNDTIQQAQVVIRGTEPLLWQPDEPHHASLVYAGPDPDAHSHTILVDETTRQLFFSPLVINACAREAARTVNREQRPQMIALAESLSVLEERLIIERFAPESPIPESLRGVYRLAESTPRKATRSGDDRVAAEEWHASFRIQWDETIANYHEVWALLDYIGKWTGIGSERRLGYGRFRVHTFSIEVVSRPATA
jgi:hypothetical protein